MPSYKLKYFDGQGRAEVIRLLFVLAGQDFEDVRFSFESWASVKPTIPYGKVPILEIDSDLTLFDSQAISRYLAKQYGYMGSSALEEARIDMIMAATSDLIGEAVPVHFESDQQKKAALAKGIEEGSLKAWISKLEGQLGDRDWLVGDKMSVADLEAMQAFSNFLPKVLGQEAVEKASTKISALAQRVQSVPVLAKHISQRGVTPV